MTSPLLLLEAGLAVVDVFVCVDGGKVSVPDIVTDDEDDVDDEDDDEDNDVESLSAVGFSSLLLLFLTISEDEEERDSF